jgi:hypothetical protein
LRPFHLVPGLALAACGPGEQAELTVSEVIPTVVTARWTTPEPTVGWVEYGPDRDYAMRTPPTAESTEHEVVLLGLWEDERFHLRTVSEDGDTGPHQTVRTGELPAHAPRLEVSGDTTSWSGYQLLPFGGELRAAGIVDPEGRLVWFYDPGSDLVITRAILAVDGEGVLIPQLAISHSDDRSGTQILHVSWDGTVVRPIDLPMLDHDLTQLPDGTIAGLCAEAREGYTAVGDVIVEVSLDGALTEVWNGWDAFDPAEIGAEFLEEEHWTHANAIGYDPVSDSYIVSFRHLNGLVRIDRASGEILWGLSGEVNDFAFTEGSQEMEGQHQFQLVEGGILVFDNGWPERGWSRAVEYALDTDAMTAEQVWEHIHEDRLLSAIKGDVSRFDDGATQIVWSANGQIQDIDPDGSVRWQLETEWGIWVGYSQRVDDLYQR